MLTIHYNLGNLLVTVTSSVKETYATLADLYPSVPSAPARSDGSVSALFSITEDQSGFSVNGGGDCYQTAEPDTLVPALEYSIRKLYIAQAGQAWALHSSGFLTAQGDAVLTVGKPGTGKTTLALRAIAGGASGLSDELHFWYPREGLVVGYPGSYTIKEGTFRMFPELRPMIVGAAPSRWDNHRLWYVNPGRFGNCKATKPATLRALVFLSREGDRRSLRSVPHWKRLSALLPHIWIPGSFPFGERLDAVMTALETIDVWEGGPEAVLETFMGHSALEHSS